LHRLSAYREGNSAERSLQHREPAIFAASSLSLTILCRRFADVTEALHETGSAMLRDLIGSPIAPAAFGCLAPEQVHDHHAFFTFFTLSASRFFHGRRGHRGATNRQKRGG
jgi:hypothetical protein